MNGVDVDFHTRIDPHKRSSQLADVILGGQDGVVNVLGVILGVAAATESTRVVLAAGLAAAIAESLSMAAVAYTSRRAEQGLYESEVARERRHIDRVPELEADEIRAIYRDKGFDGALLDEIVATITANKEVWLNVMVAEELHLQPIDTQQALRAAFVVGSASLVGSLLPLLPFFFIAVTPASWIAVAVAAVTLFGVGAYKSVTTVGHWLWAGIEMTAIGLTAAAAGWIVGLLFRAR